VLAVGDPVHGLSEKLGPAHFDFVHCLHALECFRLARVHFVKLCASALLRLETSVI
jgi:hypothetical protein